MARRLPKYLDDTSFPWFWHDSRRFVAHGMRPKMCPRGTKHFTGGPTRHKGSRCPQCRKRLTLLWDVGLHDESIPEYVKDGFAPAERLPFYVCWQCVAASYVVLSDSRMKCFPFDCHTEYLKEDETPFREAPDELPRRRIVFERIPSTIDAILSLADTIGHDALDKPAQRALNDYFGMRVPSPACDLEISQFGGQPLVYQGHHNMVCPNPKCPAGRLEHPFGEMVTKYLMREMALIHWRDEPVLKEHCFQLLYYVCGICFSLRAEYRCT